MNHLLLVIMSFFMIHAQEVFSTPSSKQDHYDIVVIGAGPGGLATSLRLKNMGKEVHVFSTTLGGPALEGKTPTMWTQGSSWKHHAQHKISAESWGISTKDVNGKSHKEDLKAYVQRLMKEIGPENLSEGYTLLEVKTDRDNPNTPIQLIFKIENTGEFKTIYANGVVFAISPEDLKRVKFSS